VTASCMRHPPLPSGRPQQPKPELGGGHKHVQLSQEERRREAGAFGKRPQFDPATPRRRQYCCGNCSARAVATPEHLPTSPGVFHRSVRRLKRALEPGGAIVEAASQRVTRLGGVLARWRPPTASPSSRRMPEPNTSDRNSHGSRVHGHSAPFFHDNTLHSAGG